MIDLYYWPTPNGHKITIFLEEAGLDYVIKPVDISAGDQFDAHFLSFSPNNRMPATIDHAPADGGDPITTFESGAILIYLAEKTGKFLPNDVRGRNDTLQWLMWQMGGLGPMAGQNHHFNAYAPDQIPYAIERYVNETNRLYGVLNKQLKYNEYINGDYSIADMACYPWTVSHERQKQDLNDFPSLKRWYETMQARPAVIEAYKRGEGLRNNSVTEAGKSVLFGQTAAVVKGE
ncbi:MAG: glutathione binding-like protein [Hyphomicrobiales bacterium]